MGNNKISNITNTTTINYPALEYLNWFNSDSGNVQTLCNNVFRGGYNITDPDFQLLLAAAQKAVVEVEDDTAKIKEFLAQIIPPNNI